MRILILLLTASLAHGAVTIKTVRTSGGTHAGTLAGLQTAVDECRALDSTDPCIIEIEAGLTLSNGTTCHLVLDAQSEGPKMIVIRSSRISELPENVRVTESDATKMAKIENACTASPGVVIVPPETTGTLGTAVASHYLLQCLELHYSGDGRNAGGALNIGLHTNGATKAKAYWQAPHTIMVDRVWAHGNDTETWVTASNTHANQNGVRVDGRNITIKNGLFNHNNMDGVDHGQGESKGLAGSNSPGPLYIYNNEFDGAITSLIGGEAPWIPGLVTTYGDFFGNKFTRNPYAWHWDEWDTTDTLDTSQPCVTGSFWEQKVSPLNKWKCVAGAWTLTSDNRINRGWTKNGFEFKSIRLARVSGNYIYRIPSTGDQSQYGFCWLINQVDGQDGAFFARVEDVQFLFNHCDLAGQGPTAGGLPFATAPYRQNNNIRIRHNLITNMGGVRVSPKQGSDYTTGGGTGLQSSWIGSKLAFEKNTVTYDRANGGTFMRVSDTSPIIADISLRDNIGFWGALAQSPLDITNESCAAFRTVLTGAAYWDNFGLVDTNSRGSSAFTTLFGGSGCPANVSRAADIAAVKFVDADNGDFRLCTDTDTPAAGCTTSPWATSASDGGPLGADAQQVSRMTAGAVAGAYDPGLFNMQIKAYVGNELRYTPYHPRGACTVTVRKGNTQTHSQDDEGLIVGERTMSVSTSGAGEYVTRITCKDAAGNVKGWREFEFKRYN